MTVYSVTAGICSVSVVMNTTVPWTSMRKRIYGQTSSRVKSKLPLTLMSWVRKIFMPPLRTEVSVTLMKLTALMPILLSSTMKKKRWNTLLPTYMTRQQAMTQRACPTMRNTVYGYPAYRHFWNRFLPIPPNGCRDLYLTVL